MDNPKNPNSGFTLIELLVVISIISFLASSALYMTNVARIKAKTNVFHTNIKEIRKALSLYYMDHGYLPSSSPCGSGFCYCYLTPNWIPDMQNYMPNLPSCIGTFRYKREDCSPGPCNDNSPATKAYDLRFTLAGVNKCPDDASYQDVTENYAECHFYGNCSIGRLCP